MADRIQFRRDTAARWLQYNPILLAGEIGYVIDSYNQYKIGDGVHTWNELPLQGFNGNVDAEMSKKSQNPVQNKAITSYIDSIFYPFEVSDFNKDLTEVDTNYVTGLLTISDVLDTEQTNYRTTDYIIVDNSKDYFVDALYNFIINNSYYACVIFYDSEKNMLFSTDAKIGYYKGLNKIKKIKDALYFRVCGINGQFSVKYQDTYTTKDFQDDIQRQFDEMNENVENHKEKADPILESTSNLIDENNLVGEYTLGKRIGIDASTVDASGYAYLNIDLSATKGDNKYIIFRCTGSTNVYNYIFGYYDESDVFHWTKVGQANSGFTPALQSFYLKIPDNATHLFLNTLFWGDDMDMNDESILHKYLAASYSIAKIDSPFDIQRQFDEVNTEITNLEGFWSGKNLVWFGTSIPSPTWPLGDSYPDEVGRILNANMYNEAVGSSRAQRRTPEELENTRYDAASAGMGNSLLELIDVLEDTWTIDWEAHTWSNGARTRNLTGIPELTAWWQVVQYASAFIVNSYQVKLVLRYLINDESERDAYLHEILGDKYDKYYANNSVLQPYYSYQADIDLFVFDHSNNDRYIESDTDVESTDINVYQGALNTYVNLIGMYKPRTRICFISNYIVRNDNEQNRLNLLKDLAHSWQCPFIDLTEYLPFGMRKIFTQGYWDSDGIWHDEGFEYSESGDSFTTNNQLTAMQGISLSLFKSTFQPKQVRGKWYWLATQQQIWMQDGLHPNSDKTWETRNMYAKSLAKFINSFGDCA